MKLFSSNKWSDETIVAFIEAGGKKRETATQYLLKSHINYAFKLHHQLKIEKQSARDALVDAVLVIIDKIEKGNFSTEAKLSTFLYRIFYNKCVDLARKNSSNKIEYTEVLPEMRESSADPLRILAAKGDVKQLKSLLNQIGETCRQILLDWGAGGYSMQEIAQRAGLENAGKAKRQKYNCLQKLMKLVQKTQSEIIK